MKLFVKCCKGKESGKLYTALFADFGYRVALVSMDKLLICDFLKCSPAELANMKLDEVKDVK